MILRFGLLLLVTSLNRIHMTLSYCQYHTHNCTSITRELRLKHSGTIGHRFALSTRTPEARVGATTAIGKMENALFFSCFTLLLALQCLLPVEALIPLDCVANVTKTASSCCPKSKINGLVCGGYGRGTCGKVVPPMQYIPAVFHMDDRTAWPSRFFSQACQCEGNFFGPACDECWFGWTGPDCLTPKKVVRKDIRAMTPSEQKVFVDVLAKSMTWPSGYAVLIESDNFHSDPLNKPKFESASIQYMMAYMHRYGSRTTLFKNDIDCEKYGILDFIHDGPVFATWHRYYMLLWERMLANIAKMVHGVDDFTVPYWDWVGMKECDICTNELIGAPGQNDTFGLRLDAASPFTNWTEYCYEPNNQLRCAGCQHAGKTGKLTRRWRSFEFPLQSEIQYMFDRPE